LAFKSPESSCSSFAAGRKGSGSIDDQEREAAFAPLSTTGMLPPVACG